MDMKFIWRTWKKSLHPQKDLSLGHGLCVYDQKRQTGNRLIGFVEGYDWYHGTSNTVVIYTIKADDTTTAEILEELKKLLEEGLMLNSFPQGKLTTRIEILRMHEAPLAKHMQLIEREPLFEGISSDLPLIRRDSGEKFQRT
jgi:hypothetical protein